MTPKSSAPAEQRPAGFFASIAKNFGSLTLGMNSIGTFWVFCLMFLICADVVGRYVFNSPIRGVAEMVGYSIVTAVFLQFANTLHVGRFTRADIFIERLEANRPAAGFFFDSLYNFLGAAVFSIIAYGTYPKLERAWTTSEITGTPGDFTFIIWPFLAVIVLGAAVTAIEYAFLLIGSLRHVWDAFIHPLPQHRRGGVAFAIFVVLAVIAWQVVGSGLSSVQVGLFTIVCLLVLIYAGMPIGVAMIVLGFCGIWIIRGDPELGMRVLSRTSTEYLRNYFFGVVPLFVLMGLLVSVSDVGRDTFDIARWMLRRVKGGLGVATVAANAIFASITGSSIASAAVFTKIAAPEMLRHGYTPRFSVGVVAGSSVLGMLIPPSLLLIVYGFLAEQSVGHLFLAAIVPGLILAAAMALLIVLLAIFWPAFVGGSVVKEHEQVETAQSAAIKLTPIFALVFVVLGGIYGGIFTPTEAGAGGALGALVIALARRKLTWRKLWDTMVETGYVTVSVLFLLLGARVFGQMLAMSNLPQQMSGLAIAADLGLYSFVALYIVVVVLLGTILDSVSIMVITLPFVLPVVAKLGGDLIWFGVVSVVAVEIGLLTPPFGISCYVVKSTLDDRRITINDIFAGAFPFVIVMLLVVALLVVVPSLSLVFK